MSNDYRKTILVNGSPAKAFAALTSQYSSWWTPCVGSFDNVGDEIKFAFPPQQSYWVFQANQLSVDSYVELVCIEAHHILLDKPEASKTEWLGTLLRFKIREKAEQTEIELTHQGLSPDKHCYRVCEAGWDHFFLNSLKQYLNSGQGFPHQAS